MKQRSRQFLVLFICSLSFGLILFEQTALSVILPSIRSSMHLSHLAEQWVIDSYLLILAMCCLFSARLADRFGYRRLFIIANLGFGIACAWCALSHSGAALLAARCLQGVFGSLVLATYLILLRNEYSVSEQGRVVGTAISVGTFFFAIGPFMGGWLDKLFGWTSVFWVNIPFVLFIVIGMWLLKPEEIKSESRVPFDTSGLLSYMLALGLFVYGVMQAPYLGWHHPLVYAPIVLGVLTFAYFVRIEVRQAHPLLNVHLFESRFISAANFAIFCYQSSAVIVIFWSLWMHNVLHYSPLLIGLALLPRTSMPFLFARLGGALADKYGARVVVLTGIVMILASLVWSMCAVWMQSYVWVVPALAVGGIGMPLAFSNTVSTMLSAVDRTQAGMVAGMYTTMRSIGAVISFSLMSTIIASFAAASYTFAFDMSLLFVFVIMLMAFVFLYLYMPGPDAERSAS